jgi:hypothetical protein
MLRCQIARPYHSVRIGWKPLVNEKLALRILLSCPTSEKNVREARRVCQLRILSARL